MVMGLAARKSHDENRPVRLEEICEDHDSPQPHLVPATPRQSYQVQRPSSLATTWPLEVSFEKIDRQGDIDGRPLLDSPFRTRAGGAVIDLRPLKK